MLPGTEGVVRPVCGQEGRLRGCRGVRRADTVAGEVGVWSGGVTQGLGKQVCG